MFYRENDPYDELWEEFEERFSHLLPEDDMENHRNTANCGEPDSAFIMAIGSCYGLKIPLPSEFLNRVEKLYSNDRSVMYCLDEIRKLGNREQHQ